MGELSWWERVCAMGVLCAAAAIALPAQTFTTLHSFNIATEVNSPYSGLIHATDGNLYGTTYLGGAFGWGAIFKIAPSGALTTFYNFCSQKGCPDGNFPDSALIQSTDGNLYGTTPAGGANNYGTVIKITLNGTLTTLHRF